MKIELEQEEIEVAIIEYVASQGISIDAANASVDLKAGRGEHGMTATISIAQGATATVTPIKGEPKKDTGTVKAKQEIPDTEEETKTPAANKPLFN